MYSREMNRKICSICCNSSTEFPPLSSKCNHRDELVCIECIEKHIDTHISKGSQNIGCPQCNEILKYQDIKRIVNNELFQSYDALLLRLALRQMKDFRWCKRSNCGWGQIHNGGDDEPIITCKACGAKSCFTHDVPWHENSSCSEFSKQLLEDTAANQAYYEKNTKRCPKCEMPIEKNDGCEHMTCFCRYQFCWLCLADYDLIRKEGNHRHERTCQHHHDNLPSVRPANSAIFSRNIFGTSRTSLTSDDTILSESSEYLNRSIRRIQSTLSESSEYLNRGIRRTPQAAVVYGS